MSGSNPLAFGRSVLRVGVEPNRSVTIKKNPFYAERRPLRTSGGRRTSEINIKAAVNLEASYQEVRANQADYTYDLPPTAPAELGRQFGTTKGRFRVTGSNCVSYMAMNSGNRLRRSPVRQQPSLRRAVNYVDQPQGAMVNQSGAYAGQPTDQYLPRGSRASRERNQGLSDDQPNVSRARALATARSGHGGRWKYLLRSRRSRPAAHGARAELPVADRHQHRSAGLPRLRDLRRRRQAALAACFDDGWLVPGLLRSVRLHQHPSLRGGTSRRRTTTTWRTSTTPRTTSGWSWLREVRLGPPHAPTRTWRIDLVSNEADFPWAAWNQPTNQFFFSNRVDTRGLVYQSIYEGSRTTSWP